MTLPTTFWRCDLDGETFRVEPTGEYLLDDGTRAPLPDDVDIVIPALPCPICGGPLRRVVSLLDGRDWERQFA